ncbi:hypothetical protein [Nocardia sp. NBC_01327]|uniref:hypothetical protein n=1 Tax=Nocardia sp. NBC_01327 TaxID=2903593 RepID=UPI002E16693B|nr:hypothetical protein OG326_41770 [Nocardia sp. NBC_01327]
MSDIVDVTVADTVKWLHDEGLARLAVVGADASSPIVAYTVEVATGTVTAFPASVTGPGTDVLTLSADDLPPPTGTAKRLVVIGVTATESVLVLDLAAVPALGINAVRPETTARAWVVQLLLDPQITLTTNSADLAVPAGTRCRHTFIPGGGTLLMVDDKQPPITTVTLDSATDGPDHLDVAHDGSAELYLGTRFWQLQHVLSIGDLTWGALTAQLETPA